MKSWLLDGTGDFVIQNNSLQTVEGDEELIQAVQFLLRTFRDEWIINPLFGLDAIEILGSKQPNQNYQVPITEAVSEAILQIDRIDRVDDIASNYFPEEQEIEVYVFFSKVDGEQLTAMQRIGVNI